MYPDDSPFFIKYKESSIMALAGLLEKYTTFSGQRINFHKFSILISPKTTRETASFIHTTLQIPMGQFHSKYLRMSLDFTEKKTDIFGQFTSKISGKFASWKTRLPPLLGRVTLAKSTLS
ncbi:OLC1v1002576C1 [Oldenlandia corymbosa var. corymbosa]|uniref:OLC1v1002576C1 n=1 Tax=Oldenlandia corymbosa var. corymbosa TaxID=529605 RepID=A0AAV1D7Z4_OLDCO|nr:OLC1v1002576C1 [Oldenlandia corymbosa var. corymbosa]